MKKKTLMPQIAAPVERQTNSTATTTTTGVVASVGLFWSGNPFAGDDAE